MRAARHEPAVGRHRSHVVAEQRPAGAVDHRVDAASAGRGAHRLAHRGLPVAEHRVGPERLHARDLLGRSDRGDHASARNAGRLHRRARDAAGRRRDEHGLPRSHVRDRGDHRPRGADVALRCGSEHELAGAPQRDHRTGRHRHPLGIPAEAIGTEHDEPLAEIAAPARTRGAVAARVLLERRHRVADSDARDLVADLRDGPGELRAEHPGHRERPARRAGARVEVAVVEPARVDVDHDVAGAARRVVDLLPAHHLGSAVLAEGRREQLSLRAGSSGRASRRRGSARASRTPRTCWSGGRSATG